MTDKTKTTELTDKDLDDVSGGIALLLPAVQSAREAASLSDGAELKLKSSPTHIRARDNTKK